jgi:hypothetical protein
VSGPLDFDPPEAGDRPPARPAPVRPTGPPPPARPPGASRYGWFLGVVAVLALAYVSLNTLRSRHLDVSGPPPGSVAPPFAVPLALSTLDGDANVARRAGSGSAGRRPACSVRGPRILNLCQLGERGPVVLAFFATRGASCTGPLDAMERLRGRYPGVGFAAVSVRGDRDGLRALIRRHGWRFPVGWDRDGALVNVYGVAVCPEVLLAYPGRVVRETALGKGVTAQLDRRVRALVAGSRRRGWRPPA